jgi:hypothetical protein
VPLLAYSSRRSARPRGFGCAAAVSGWLLALWLALAAPPAWAEPQPMAAGACGTQPWVELLFEGYWPVGLPEDVRADLEAGLRLRGIELCAPDLAGPRSHPVARVLLQLTNPERMSVSIEVQDAVTDKRVLRDVDLHRLARDTWGLSLAQGADELLRASWVEITLHDAPPPALPPPAAIERAVVPPPAAPERLQALGVRVAGEVYTGGIKLLGADAIVSLWLTRVLGLSISLGLRAGLVAHAPHGRIESSALTAGAALFLPVLPPTSRYNLTVGLGGHFAELSLTGRGEAPVRTQSRNAFIASGRLLIGAYWRFSDLVRLELSLGPGVPLRTATARDDYHDVTSTRGLELHGSLGLGGVF